MRYRYCHQFDKSEKALKGSTMRSHLSADEMDEFVEIQHPQRSNQKQKSQNILIIAKMLN